MNRSYIDVPLLLYYLYICMFACMYVCMYLCICMPFVYVCIYFCICASKSSTLNNSCVCGCSSYIDQEEQLLAAARGARVDVVASLLDQGVDIQCKDCVRNERID